MKRRESGASLTFLELSYHTSNIAQMQWLD